jgi:hypothetical protein
LRGVGWDGAFASACSERERNRGAEQSSMHSSSEREKRSGKLDNRPCAHAHRRAQRAGLLPAEGGLEQVIS